jgi:hypothetical protein
VAQQGGDVGTHHLVGDGRFLGEQFAVQAGDARASRSEPPL